ncbi:MAG: hydroxymethylbilane synthase, partial [bacterium]
MMRKVRIGTRGSRLALTQAEWVAKRFQQEHPHIECETVILHTTGDKLLDASLAKIGGKGVFTKEIEAALLRGDIDVAVHSLKDLPTLQTDGLTLGAITLREDPRDLVVAAQPVDLKDLGKGQMIGTSSLRRTAQLRHINPHIEVAELRGNVPTRVRKALDGEYAAVVIAAAGFRRLGLEAPFASPIAFDDMLPAPGQGSLGLQMREDDSFMYEMLLALDDPNASPACRAERAFLHALGGGCQIPIAALGEAEGERLRLHGLVASVDGRKYFRGQCDGDAADAERLGKELARRLIEEGAGEILQALGNILESDESALVAQQFEKLPLSGKRIVVTRDEDVDGPLSRALRSLGAEVLCLPLIAHAPPEDLTPLLEAAKKISEFHWIVFTSGRALEALTSALAQTGSKLRDFRGKIACVGAATAKKVEECGTSAKRVAEKPQAENLVSLLGDLENLNGARVLFPRADRARPTLADGLRSL